MQTSPHGPVATNPQMWAYMLDRVAGEDTTLDWFFRWTFAERVWGNDVPTMLMEDGEGIVMVPR